MKRKRRQELFAFYDDTSIKMHLEKMARKGWMIEKMSNYFWTYRQIEPKNITFEITYHHYASEFDPQRSDDQMTFDEFCEHTGWNLALSWHQMQIYYNERDNPTPIQTDPDIRLETMNKAMWSNYLKAYIIFLIISAPISLMFLISLMNVPQAVIKSGSSLYIGIMCTLLAGYTSFDLTVYFRWRKKALSEAENGEFLDSPNTTIIQRGVIYFTYFVFAIWMIKNLINADTLVVLGIATYCVSLFVAAISMEKAKEMFKFLNVPRTLNKILSFVVTFIAAFISIRLLTYLILIISGSRDLIDILF